MPEKNIQPQMTVLLTGNVYEDSKVNDILDRPVVDRVGTVVRETDYDEEWGKRWLVRTAIGDVDMSEQNLSPIPRITPDQTTRGFGLRKFVDLYGSQCSIHVPPEIFTDEDVTKWTTGIHAWGVDKAIEYLRKVWSC